MSITGDGDGLTGNVFLPADYLSEGLDCGAIGDSDEAQKCGEVGKLTERQSQNSLNLERRRSPERQDFTFGLAALPQIKLSQLMGFGMSWPNLNFQAHLVKRPKPNILPSFRDKYKKY